jgi:1-deoxy-D-xylulose 5-phosphate reductoisomerase
VGVASFLAGEICLMGLVFVVPDSLDRIVLGRAPSSLDEAQEVDAGARDIAAEVVAERSPK